MTDHGGVEMSGISPCPKVASFMTHRLAGRSGSHAPR